VLAAGGDAGDRHRLDDEERVVLEDHAVLERPRLGLVCVADQVVRALGVAGDGLPLAPGGERGAAAAHQPRVGHLAQHPVRTHLDRGAERLVAAVRAVAVDALRIRDADAAQQAQRRIPGLRDAGRRRGRRVAAGEQARDVVHGDRRHRGLVRRLTRDGGQRCRRTLAHAQAGALVPDRLPVAGVRALGRDAALELGHQLLRAARDAGHVGAHVRDHGRLGLEREQRVERRDAVRLRRRDREPPADVVERAPADPADARLDGVEGREQKMALRPRGMPAARHMLVALAGLRRTLPARPGRAEDRVDRLALDRRREL
jgi:hypothetical protein